MAVNEMAMNDPMSTPDAEAHPAAAVPIDPAAAAALDRATLELAHRTDQEPSPELLPAVMQTVWAELRPGRRIPFPGSDGTLFITETAASNALVAQVDGLAGIIVRRCAVLHEPVQTPPGAAEHAGSSGGSIRVTLTAAIAYGTNTDALLNQVRAVITTAATDLIGLTVSHVDIDIVDVYPSAGQLR